ncbi:MAG: RnfABCDGE type electron transport complex subunit G [Synergistaceae bacterium]|jgi:electron transport complex protein RnfG|nr:RnfABCDGE type electron transport complex subunit G [Synergistaceae bacterium]
MPQSNAKKIASLGLTLFAVTAITGIILGAVHDITLEPIRVTMENLKTKALKDALPEADAFSRVEVSAQADPLIKSSDVFEATSGGAPVGHCITVTPRGYSGPIEIIAGITKEGRLRAISILSQSETPGLGAKSAEPDFYEQFEDREAPKLTVVKSASDAPDEIHAISGATITSNGVTDGVNAALAYWRDHLARPGAETEGGQPHTSAPAISGEAE